MPASPLVDAAPRIDALVDALAGSHPEIEVRRPGAETAAYALDAGTRREIVGAGPAVAFPADAQQVQRVVRAAAAAGVAVVPRGAGSGLSGGARADAAQLVLSTERLTRVIEVSPGDEVAVVEPGVVNADLNAVLAPHGLFYAPDPASYAISSIGGNIATNAGGLRCAKYGVTRESVLALDVVLADGSLVSVGHRSIKGVTGYDLVSLLVGSEGTLGIVVAATVRVRPLPVARRTVTAFFPSTAEGAEALGAITRTRVRPSVVEFLDEPSLDSIDRHSGTSLRARGASLVLVELDGFGIDEQTAELSEALIAAGGAVRTESDADGAVLWELRRSGRGIDEGEWFLGGDVAVPKSRLPEVYAAFAGIARRHDVRIAAVAHAGDGNLHPSVTRTIPEGGDPAHPDPALHEALEDIARLALSLGGTVTGEHGIGSVKRELAALELSDRVIDAHRAVKDALDPQGLLNPGKAY
ncbi:FAD-linked oxidase C-terminal domain-containing protein [Microbacterium betulae]|uniref:FAD-linked oxidase C-terminal domain-containing protein n=1 Tax=Microbacterium betulae TaxID=2981139 RepID=A0AA97FJW7_9MICO|nr:FAD-linked oxidase C-terminal domain-containing protein [Microbacterium sp. AB]WOF24139.1 FAD-linked oxidase C-terminal domain-containing protein [Microbacterium sp. AB]